MNEPAAPRQSATAVLLRDRPGGGVEAYMLRRPSRSSFAATAYVFPGGALDEQDEDPALLELTTGFDPTPALERMVLDDTPGGRARCTGLHVAAVREVLEEAGLLLGRRADGATLTTADAPAIAAARAELLAGAPLAGVLERHLLRIDPGALVYVAHFITPVGEPRRYDTRFFVAHAPPEQVALVHAREATEGGWFAPEDLLERHGDDLRTLLPPTRILLGELVHQPSAAVALSDLGRRPVSGILFTLEEVLSGRLPDRLPPAPPEQP